METAIEGCRSRTPPAWNGGFKANLIAGRGTQGHQVGISHSGFQILPHTKPHSIHHCSASLKAANLILILDHPRLEHEIARVGDVLNSRVYQCVARRAVETS